MNTDEGRCGTARGEDHWRSPLSATSPSCGSAKRALR